MWAAGGYRFVMVTNTLSPLRHTSMNTGVPSCAFCSSRVIWLTLATFWRFTSRMTSPGMTPAFAAGLFRSRSLTMAPNYVVVFRSTSAASKQRRQTSPSNIFTIERS